ncbi:ribokinase [Pseudarthrobacter sp. N5]|uniref:ribokinase n=1 Tax=Pseudarthrobacter sp. N5 TaxID=3418416 RepID=UPI003CEAD377
MNPVSPVGPGANGLAKASRPGRIVVVGSLNADLTIYCERLPQPGETVHGNGFAVNPGGKSANQAVAASKLGGTVSLIGAVGDDANGAMLLASTAGAGVDVAGVRRSADVATGVAVIAVDAQGENNIIISAGANGTLGPADIAASADVFDGASVVCLCLEVSLETVEAAARSGHDAGATVLLNLSPYAEIAQSLADLSDVLLVNAHEASLFLGDAEMPDAGADASAWEPVRRQFEEHGLKRVLVTLGAQGSVVLDSQTTIRTQITRIAPTKVNAVDTTGAGDAFTGAVAARLAAGETLGEAAAFASVTAALAATKKGTQAAYPGVEDVLANLRVS